MRRLHEELFDLRVPPEALARWALETSAPVQEATYSAILFALQTEYASLTLLPVPGILVNEAGALDPDGFLRQPRGAIEHFRLRSSRAAAWMELCIFFRERFQMAAARKPPTSLDSLAVAFSLHDTPLEAAVDLLVRESVLPELEELILRTVTYPPLQLLLTSTRGSESQRGGEARRMAGAIIGDLRGKRLWQVRRRLVATATRAILGARPLFEELERAGLKADRARAARGFARRLEEALGELPGARVIPQAIVDRLASFVSADPGADPIDLDGPQA